MIPLGEVVTFDVITSLPTTGAAGDATAIVYDVYEDETDTPILADQTMTKRFTGHYRGNFTVNPAASAFEVGKWYNVIVEATVGGVDAKAIVMTFRVSDFESKIDRNADLIESHRGAHTWQGDVYYVSPNDGSDAALRGTRALPLATIKYAHDNYVTDSNHDVIILLADATGLTTATTAASIDITKNYCFIRGPGRDFLVTRSGNGNTFNITGDGVELSGFQVTRPVGGTGNAIQLTNADFLRVNNVWINATRAHGIDILNGENCQITDNTFTGAGQSAASAGIHIDGTVGSSHNVIADNIFRDTVGDAIKIETGTTDDTTIQRNTIEGSSLYGINIGASSTSAVVSDNTFGNNSSGNISDAGTTTVLTNNRENGVLMPVNVEEIDLDPISAANLQKSTRAILGGEATATTLTTVSATTDITGVLVDRIIGAQFIVTSGSQIHARSWITDFTVSGGLLTWSPAIPAALADTDTFVLV